MYQDSPKNAATPSRQSQVREQLSLMHQSSEYLFKQVAELSERLKPVRFPKPSPQTKESTEAPSMCPLASELADLNKKLHVTGILLSDLLADLEV